MNERKDDDERAVSRSKVSRRQTLRWASAALAVSPLGALGCSEDETPPAAGDAGESQAGASGGTAAVTGWASGGTGAITDITSYPNPFEPVTDPACTPTCAMTLGPCHDDLAPEREDVSEGQPGLPTRLGLRILDASCQPVTDASVDIWHCDAAGLYSSETVDSPAFCTGNDATALAAQWFRGHRMTDQQGVAWFNTCFPGWYPGRAIHIHVTIRRSDRDGDAYLTTQIAFPEDLTSELFDSHPDYVAHGQPDTSNAADGAFPAEVAPYTVETQRMEDGVLLAWKTLIIRSSLAGGTC